MTNSEKSSEFGAPLPEDKRFGCLARWAGFVTGEQLVECLCDQQRMGRAGQSAPPLGEIMQQKKYLKPSQLKAILKVQSMHQVERDDNLFGQIAVQKEYVTEQQLQECLEDQARCVLAGGEAPFIGNLLLEKRYILERQIDAILRYQRKHDTGTVHQLHEIAEQEATNDPPASPLDRLSRTVRERIQRLRNSD